MATYSIANLLLVTASSALFDHFSSYLTDQHYTVWQNDGKSPLDDIIARKPDLILVDVSSEGFEGFSLIQAIKDTAPLSHIPVICLASERTDQILQKCLSLKADEFFLHDIDLDEMLILMKPLLRLSTMFRELNERVELAKKEGLKSARSTLILEEHLNQKILLVQPLAGDKATIETLLDGKYIVEVTDDFFDAEEHLSTGGFVACICALHQDNLENVLGLCSRTRNNPRLFNLPMLVLDDKALDHPMDAYRRGVTRVTRRPLHLDALKTKLTFLINRQHQRWAIRQALDTTKNAPLIDEATQCYHKDFFLKHLDELVISAHKWQKNLSVIFFSISNLESVRTQFGEKAADHLMQQTSQWISSLVRVEDMIARFDDQEFCVALTDTPLDETQIVMHRIAGILSYTDFAIRDVFQPLSVWVEVGSSTLDPQDSADQIIEKARKNID